MTAIGSAILLGLLINSSVLASSTITLKGGNIPPAQRLKIPLNVLVPNIYYELTCKIINPNTDKVIIATSSDDTLGGFGYRGKLNGQDFLHQASLNPEENTLYLYTITSFSPHLILINADQEESIFVESCLAVALKGP